MSRTWESAALRIEATVLAICMSLPLMLAACGAEAPPSEATQNEAPPAPPPERPSFSLDEVDARDLVDRLGAPWIDLTMLDPSPDSFSGGFLRTLSNGRASAQINTLGNGKVWNLQVRSGMADRCGPSAPVHTALPKVLDALSVRLDATQLARLEHGLAEKTIEKVEIGNIRVTAAGGCLPNLDVRTTWSGEDAI